MSHVLSVKDINKSFPGVQALENVSIDFEAGEVHGLVGMNGSGKSTLMKIITGVLRPDSGEILFNGKREQIRDINDSRRLGISIIFQEMSLVPSLSVAENIFLGHLPGSSFRSIIDWKAVKRKAQDLLEKLNVDIRPEDYIEDLSIAQRQMVEIAKALSINAQVILMDEPSAVLTLAELKTLFQLIRSLKNQGVSVIYISHRLEEVFEIADRASILRDGRLIDTVNIADIKPSSLIEKMIGRKMGEMFPERQPFARKNKRLEVRGLNSRGLRNINLDVYEHEILGIFGLVGSGQTDLVESIFGVDADEFSVTEFSIDGQPVKITSPSRAIKSGMALVPEDRKKNGLMQELVVKNNILITFLNRLKKRFGLIDTRKEKSNALELISKLQVKTPSMETKVRDLSGGNQQKVVIAKWLGKGSKVFVCHEPTRGIDIEAKSQVYKILEEMRRSGAGVLFISSEISEIIGMSDRIFVINKGQLKGPIDSSEAGEEILMSMAAGME